MAFSKTTTFFRTVKYTKPHPTTPDQMVEESFVAGFQAIPQTIANELRAKSGGVIKDQDCVTHALKTVDGTQLAESGLLEDAIGVSAASRTYFQAIQDGVAGKNSAT